MRVGVANGQNTAPNLTPTQLARDFRAMARLCDVMGYSELGEDRDHKTLRRTLDPEHWWTAGASECVVVGRRSVLRLLDHETTWVLPKGKEGVNPRRPLEVAIVEYVPRPSLGEFYIAATHWTNGAYSTPNQRAEEWRDNAWLKCWQNTDDKIDELSGHSLSGIIVGDFNSRIVPRFQRRQEWLDGSTGIDKGATIEVRGGIKFAEPENHTRVRLASKHDGLVWKIGLRHG